MKDGFRHIYQKRVFFIDEDSWQVQVADMYDNRGELYRVGVAYGVNYYEVPTQWSTLDVYHDLNSRRYLAIGLDNEEEMYDLHRTPTRCGIHTSGITTRRYALIALNNKRLAIASRFCMQTIINRGNG